VGQMDDQIGALNGGPPSIFLLDELLPSESSSCPPSSGW